MDPDGPLLDALATDLDAAFPAVARAHADRLYSIALRLTGDPGDAEEVAQDTLLRAYRALASYDRARIEALHLRPWLTAIGVRLARNKRRRVADRRPPRSLDDLADGPGEPTASPGDDPSSQAQTAMLGRLLAQALEELGPAHRAAVVLRHVAGLSVSETAEALGRPEATIRSDTLRGLTRLRAIVSRLDPTLDPSFAPLEAHR